MASYDGNGAEMRGVASSIAKLLRMVSCRPGYERLRFWDRLEMVGGGHGRDGHERRAGETQRR